jgi:V/A-type H+-transporting ATPase subunit D
MTMAHMDTPPTRSNLRRINSELAFAREGFDLLDRKREILVMEIMKKAASIRSLERDLALSLGEFYDRYKAAVMDMGAEMIIQKALSEKSSRELSPDNTVFMGLRIPGMILSLKSQSGPPAMCGTSASYDEARRSCLDIIPLIVEYANLMKRVIILSRELKKVQRKVNMLERIFIPEGEERARYISGRLEEMERDEIYSRKLLKSGGG